MPGLGPVVKESTNASGPSPRGAVRKQFLRAGASLVLAPLRAVEHFVRQSALRRAVLLDLAHPAEVDPGPDDLVLPDRPLRVFVSCAEPSGEAHAVNLVRALRDEAHARGAPEPELCGLGGERLADVGVRTVGNPVSRAAMGAEAVRSVSFYAGLLEEAARCIQEVRPDVCVPVDSPALHVPLGSLARGYGVPVVHFVTPQYWAWAPWRVGGYRQAVDLALTILPFEPPWFERHGVHSAHVGHPELDVLADVDVPAPDDDGRRTLILLPGSREKVVALNLPWMLVAAARMRLMTPEIEVVLPHDREDLRALLEEHVARAGATDWVRIAIGTFQEELGRARVALTVSGTVLIDLLHHRIPCAVIYRLGNALTNAVSRRILTVPWFASTNLLAGREVVPEHSFHGMGPIDEVATFLARCVREDAFRAEVCAGLDDAAGRLGPLGATRRAARHALAVATGHPEIP